MLFAFFIVLTFVLIVQKMEDKTANAFKWIKAVAQNLTSNYCIPLCQLLAVFFVFFLKTSFT